MAQFAVSWTAPLSATAGTISVGDCVVNDGTGYYVKATSANRGTKRSDGIAVTAGSSSSPITIIPFGPVTSAITGLGAGTASWVRVSSAGVLERFSPSTGGSDDIVGWCETDGSLHAAFGYVTSTIATGGNIAAAQAMSALNVDWSLGIVFTKTLSSGSNTITFSNQSSGQVIVVRLTGSSSTVSWPVGVKWPSGSAPTQTTSGTDVYTFVYDGTNTYGSVVQAMA